MKAQIIEKDGHPEFVVLPYEAYVRLLKEAEMLQDIRDYDAAKGALERGEELIPSEVTFSILDGEHPIKVWRKYRGMTQAELAKAARISVPYLSQIETGNRVGKAEVLAAVAKALGLSIDDIFIPSVEIKE